MNGLNICLLMKGESDAKILGVSSGKHFDRRKRPAHAEGGNDAGGEDRGPSSFRILWRCWRESSLRPSYSWRCLFTEEL